jgi:subtilisin family serine protease
VAILLAFLGVLPLAAAAQPAPGAAQPAVTVEPAVTQAIQANGRTDFWVMFAAEADTSAAYGIADWAARGQYVYDQLTRTAAESQAGLVGALTARGIPHQAFHAVNAVRINGGDQAALDLAVATPGVSRVLAPRTYAIPEPAPEADSAPNVIEWGISNINADDVWSTFGVRGEGIVVANIDTGVQFDHPALVNQYRGNTGGGTFNHNYNWFDAAGNCATAPCDLNGHGTHTMGTMVGDDGSGNQIGVAPAAKWIAANGCCPSDAALIASGEWMLAPEDLNGANPRPDLRPHIINNSWGSTIPSNDPFMEEILEDWADAGIFGQWSNGNSGPNCNTSGSPGSRIINYSAGAYDINNVIAGFSARGPGQDGEIKPNIAAPGVNVRSSLPGNAYGNFSGTSMASPHVAGTIALMWSAAPSLVGNTPTTKTILDDTARNLEDLQCGGTADDNNVWGEGRVDAFAAVQASPRGPTGTLSGTVTDESTGAGIAGATVSLTVGGLPRSATTDANGNYSFSALPVGTYDVTASAFGYGSETASATITEGATTILDFALAPVPNVTVSGTVTDGSGHGWPVYAKVSVQGTSVSDYSNPFSGEYSVTLPANATYTFVTTPQYPGYETLTETVVVGSSNLAHDIELVVDAEACAAPGYQFGGTGLPTEDFNDEVLPDGWTVVDHAGTGEVWRFDNPGNRQNLTGGDGGFAIVDSDFFGTDLTQDTSLVTPLIDLTGVADPVIRFNQDFNWWVLGLDEQANVDLSIDGGATWTTVLNQQDADVPGPRLESVPIPQAANEPDVQVRFHYGPADFEFWWQVDNVAVGACEPIDGGLVAGIVRDDNTNAGIVGATVTSEDDPDTSATTAATPDDPGLADGFYWLFSSLTGRHDFTASAENYVSQTRRVNVAPDATTQANFRLGAGLLTLNRDSVSATVRMGDSASRTFRITNEGTAPASVELTESGGDFEILGGTGPSATGGVLRHTDNPAPAAAGSSRAASGLGSQERDGAGWATNGPAGSGRSASPMVPQSNAPNAITITHSLSQEIVQFNSVACTGGGTTRDNGYLRTFVLEDFDITGDFNVTNVSFGIETLTIPQDVTVNLYTLEGEFVYANMTLIGSTVASLSPQDLTIVDVPVEGTAPAGSTLVVEVDVPDMPTGAFFIGSNPDGQTAPSYLRSATCGLPEPTDAAEVGFPDMHIVMNVTGDAGGDVPWLSVNPPSFTLQPGQSVVASVIMDGNVDQPGTYTAQVAIGEDTPYSVGPVDVTMNVPAPRSWGKITGTVTSIACGGGGGPIEGAIVQIDGLQFDVTLLTGEDGTYAYWLGSSNNPLRMIVAANDHIPQTRVARIIRGQTVVENFALREIC